MTSRLQDFQPLPILSYAEIAGPKSEQDAASIAA
jgi:hypothetical protein